jgi:hypothetical protein
MGVQQIVAAGPLSGGETLICSGVPRTHRALRVGIDQEGLQSPIGETPGNGYGERPEITSVGILPVMVNTRLQMPGKLESASHSSGRGRHSVCRRERQPRKWI